MWIRFHVGNKASLRDGRHERLAMPEAFEEMIGQGEFSITKAHEPTSQTCSPLSNFKQIGEHFLTRRYVLHLKLDTSLLA